MGYARSLYPEIESFLRNVVGLNEDDFQLILKQYFSNFSYYKISPGIYLIEDISDDVYTMGDHERTLRIRYDDISMKTKLTLTRFDEHL